MVIECGICGKEFEGSSNRKYCDECSPKQDILKKKLAKEMARSKAMYSEPVIHEFKCETCGLVWKNTKYPHHGFLDSDGVRHVFCSAKCRKEALPKFVYCFNCRGEIPSERLPMINLDNQDTWVCCDKCQEELNIKMAKARGFYHTCEICGKNYIRNTKVAHWCSDECKIKYKEKQKELEKNKTIDRFEACPVCHKVIKKTYKIKKIPTSISCCCDEHQRIYDNYILKQNELKKKSIDGFKKIVAPKKPEPKTVPLCSTCKVPYKDCYLMKSDFRNAPKGAKFDGKGNIIECPLFK